MSSQWLADWSTSYLLYPGTAVYPGPDTFPDAVDEVTNATTTVYGRKGSRWDRVTDTSAYEDIVAATGALTEAVGKIPVALENVTRSSDGKSVNGAVVEEIIARWVTGEEGEFVKLTADQIAANAINSSHISAGSIDGMVITGATIQTAASGLRVTMDKTGLYAYNAKGATTFRLDSSTGSVFIRGNVGISDTWSTTRFMDIVARDTMKDVAQDGFKWGSGILFTVDDEAVSQHGTVALVKAPNTSDYRFRNQYGLRVQPARRSNFTVYENGLCFYGSDTTSTQKLFWGTDERGFYGESPYYGVQLYCYDRNPVGGAAGFWALAPNVDQNSNRTFHLSTTKNAFWAYSDKYLLRVDNENLLYRTAYNTAVSRLIHGGMDFSYLHLTHSAFYIGLGWTTSSNTTRNSRRKLYLADNDADSALEAQKVSAMLRYGGNQAYVNGTAFYTYNCAKNFIMGVPTLSENRGGMLLQHSVTESPGMGIEYWHTEEIPESGVLFWTLPDYVPYIASEHGPRSVFVTMSEGTATAVLHDELDKDSGWFVEVRGTPGATANVLVKMYRIKGGDNEGYTDEVWQEWVLPNSGHETLDRSLSGTGALGPLPELESRLADRAAEELLLADAGVDPDEVRKNLNAAGMTDAPLMWGVDAESLEDGEDATQEVTGESFLMNSAF